MRTPFAPSIGLRFLLVGLLAAVSTRSLAAPISTLFSTGLDANGQPLPAQAEDPHYRLVLVPDPADPEAAGLETNAPTSTLRPGFPVGPWIAESAVSRWIAPKADQSGGSDPGDYLYRTTFDLTGLDPATARIVGRWTSDNMGRDIVLNGASLGISQGGDFGTFADFEITTGFVDGTNVLDFVINNAPPGVNPTGLRVEITRATADKPGDPPAILRQPTGALLLVGDALTLAVEADGTQPLTYEWRRDGAAVGGAIETNYTIATVALGQAGDYTVVVANAFGSQTSVVAQVRVLEPVAGVFATGVDAAGIALEDYAEDPHYRLITNPNGPETVPMVHDSTVFPIVSGPWVANTETSKWIAPVGETSASAGGDYVYRLTFTLPSEFDPSTAVLFGGWATDNDGLDIVVNGASTGLRNTVQFAALTRFEITNKIVAGANIVDFKVNNSAVGYTALRLDPLRLGALRGAGCKLRIAAQPVSFTAFLGSPAALTVVADGCAPLTYQWKKDGVMLSGKTAASLDLGNLAANQAGVYTVEVGDSTGATRVSDAATVLVLEPIGGLFNTGVNTNGQLLDDGAVDPHYRLVVNPQDNASSDVLVEDSTGFPIVAGPWVANSETSKWVGPTLDTVGVPGDYTYQTTFVIPADFDPATVRVEGLWTSDNNALDVLVNGASTGLSNTGAFGSLGAFRLEGPFRTGTNTIDFKISNPGTDPNPTGLRIEGIRADGLRGAPAAVSLSVGRSGDQLRFAWPVSAAGFKLHAAPQVRGAPFVEVNAPVKVEGNENVVTLIPGAATEFFRLLR